MEELDELKEKARAYDEALERASKLRVQNPFDTVSQMMEYVFPELKESEDDDEAVRKELIDAIYGLWDNDMIEWYSGKNENRVRLVSNWLKSIKQKIEWKPTKEQMKALHDLNLVGNISYVGQGQLLIELYNDLMKLIE